MSHLRGLRRVLCAVVLWGVFSFCWFLLVTPSWGLTINLTFNSSTQFVDSNGVNRTNELTSLMQTAAGIWEDIIEDPHTLDITYQWGDLEDTTIGLCEYTWPSGSNRPHQATITADTHQGSGGAARDWFFDPTPLDNEEFGMSFSYYRDTSPANQTAWYNGSPPDFLEMQYSGTATAGVAGDPISNHDLLTVMLHEIGHAVGVPGSTAGLSDGDYDVPSVLVGGNVMAVIDDDGHLLNDETCMAAVSQLGERRLPSATDVLAAASTAGWSTLDLPRKHFLQGTDWSTSGNWLGNRVPDAQDDVFLVSDTTNASLSADAVAKNLRMTEGAKLAVANFTLEVEEEIHLHSFASQQPSKLSVYSGGRVVAEDISVVADGDLVMWGGEVVVNKLTLGFPATTSQFSMLPDATLTVNRLVGFGDSPTFLGNLKLGHAGPDTGLLTIGAGQTLDVLGTTTVGAGLGGSGTINVVEGGEVETRDLVVGTATSSGTVVVDGFVSGIGIPARWDVDGNLTVGSTGIGNGDLIVQRNGHLSVASAANVQGTTFDGQGTLTVRTGASVDIASTLTLSTGATVNLSDAGSSLTVGAVDNNGGTVHWTGGTLHIDNGRLRIDDSSFADLQISDLTVGQDMILKVTRVTGGFDSLAVGNIGDGNMTIENGGVVESYNGYVGEAGAATGTVTVTGTNSRWSVTEDLCLGYINNSSGALSITSGGQAEANSVWLGQSDSAFGMLSVRGINSSFTSHAVLAVGGLVLDNGTGGSAGGSGSLDIGEGGYVDVEKTLKVWDNGNVTVYDSGSRLRADSLELVPGAILTTTPGTIVQTNRLVGFGDAVSFAGSLSLGITNGTGEGSHSVSAGQTLEVSESLVVGNDGPGLLQITGGGHVTSQNGLIGQQDGASGSLVEIIDATSTWEILNSLEIGAGSSSQYDVRLVTKFGGRVEVGDTIQVLQNAELELSPGILLAQRMEVEEGGLFDADGVMSLGTAGTLENSGTLALGEEGIGKLSVKGGNYTQTFAGSLEIDLGGLLLDESDHLDVQEGSVDLNGGLRVSLVDPLGGTDVFIPTAKDSFRIITAAGELTGSFFAPAIDLPSLTGNLYWNIQYQEDGVILEVLTPYSADFDGDGDVDGDDLSIWQGAYAMDEAGDADTDGDTDGADFLLWQQQYTGSLSLVNAATAVPEPTAVTLALLGCVGLVFRRRR